LYFAHCIGKGRLDVTTGHRPTVSDLVFWQPVTIQVSRTADLTYTWPGSYICSPSTSEGLLTDAYNRNM